MRADVVCAVEIRDLKILVDRGIEWYCRGQSGKGLKALLERLPVHMHDDVRACIAWAKETYILGYSRERPAPKMPNWEPEKPQKRWYLDLST